MPELPEVEIQKRYADATSLHQGIATAEVHAPEVLDGVSEQTLVGSLEGEEFLSTARHGKYLFLELSDGKWTMFHFGMTGRFSYFKGSEDVDYDRFNIRFQDGHHLAFLCPRKLGKIGLADSVSTFVSEKGLGPDALSLGPDRFLQLFDGRRAMIKSALMNQRIVAGIGNVYSDEILFQTGIYPKTKVSDLRRKDMEEIYDAMEEILGKAIALQTDWQRLPDDYLITHRSEGEPCPVCGAPIKRTRVSGRSAYYCPNRQKK